jgi:hypothetical protein
MPFAIDDYLAQNLNNSMMDSQNQSSFLPEIGALINSKTGKRTNLSVLHQSNTIKKANPEAISLLMKNLKKDSK